jgi:hypothetical protein
MIDTRPVRKEMLNGIVTIVTDKTIDFDQARAIADKKAQELTGVPMLLAWYDKKTGRHSPPVVCGCGITPSWLDFAQSRDGNISIDMNDLQYVFIYRSAGE